MFKILKKENYEDIELKQLQKLYLKLIDGAGFEDMAGLSPIAKRIGFKVTNCPYELDYIHFDKKHFKKLEKIIYKKNQKLF